MKDAISDALLIIGVMAWLVLMSTHVHAQCVDPTTTGELACPGGQGGGCFEPTTTGGLACPADSDDGCVSRTNTGGIACHKRRKATPTATPTPVPPFIIGMAGASNNTTPTDSGLTSYTTEYMAYLVAKYPGVTYNPYLCSPTGCNQLQADAPTCGVSFDSSHLNITQMIADNVKVLIVHPRLSDQNNTNNCTAAQTDAALQNVYDEGTAAGITVWIETPFPIDNNLTTAAIRQTIHDYVIAHFPRVIDMTTGLANPDYTANCAYFCGPAPNCPVPIGNACGLNLNVAGNTLAEQRTQAALGY